MKNILQKHGLWQFRQAHRKGVFFVLAVICLMGAMTFVGMSVDLGMITLTKTRMQTAADSAALSAAQKLCLPYGEFRGIPRQGWTWPRCRPRRLQMLGRWRCISPISMDFALIVALTSLLEGDCWRLTAFLIPKRGVSDLTTVCKCLSAKTTVIRLLLMQKCPDICADFRASGSINYNVGDCLHRIKGHRLYTGLFWFDEQRQLHEQ